MVFITHSVDEAVMLGDRIMVMTAQPGRVKTFVQVPLARPRNIIGAAEDAGIRRAGRQHLVEPARRGRPRARAQEEEITP